MSELFQLREKVAIITGGGGALGGAMALGLAQHGAKVVLTGRKLETLDLMADKIKAQGGEVMTLAGNVLHRKDLEGMRAKIIDHWGSIDILVNAAGGNQKGATILPEESFFDMSIDSFDEVARLNLTGTVLPCQIFGKAMKDRGKGSIINISSLTAYTPFTRVVGYSASKSAVTNFTKWLATEMAMKFGEGIRVNAIAPGVFIGAQNKSLLLNEDGTHTKRGAAIIARTPMKRFGYPEELISTVVYLSCDASHFVTGAIIPVDGGFLAYSGI